MLRNLSHALVLTAAVSLPVWGLGCAESAAPPASEPSPAEMDAAMDEGMEHAPADDAQGSTVGGGAEVPE